MGSIKWNISAINDFAVQLAEQKTRELHARVSAKGIGATIDGTSVIATDPDALMKEYGTATIEPEPWGITSLMEMSQ